MQLVSDYIRQLLHRKPFNLSEMKENIILRCEDLLDRDVKDNKTMGLFGSKAILQGRISKKLHSKCQMYATMIDRLRDFFFIKNVCCILYIESGL